MARRFTRPFMYDSIGRSSQTLQGSTETPKNQDTAQSFQRTLQVGHCLIASGPAALSVGFCTVVIVTSIVRGLQFVYCRKVETDATFVMTC